MFSSNLSTARLLLRFLNLITVYPLSILTWIPLRILSTRYKVSIYVLKTFRPGWGSTYTEMMEPLCRQLQFENNTHHIKILVDPGKSVNDVLVKSYKSHFTIYLDDKKKIFRLIAYLIPKSGLEKHFINTSNNFKPSWILKPSKNYANLENKLPADLSDIGIKKNNFVLFAHASKNYYKDRVSKEVFLNLEHRFYDLSSYGPALTKLIENNYKVVRIGLQVDALPSALKELPIIDYTGKNRTEIGELWLYENCKFLLSATSGAYWLARRFDRPTLLTNSYVLPFGYYSTLYTPMTFRSIDTGKILSLVEMHELRKKPDYLENQFMRVNRVELMPNSSLTIANAVEEILNVSNESRVPTSEDLKLMDRYNAILASYNIAIVEKMTTPAISFLREYRHLL